MYNTLCRRNGGGKLRQLSGHRTGNVIYAYISYFNDYLVNN